MKVSGEAIARAQSKNVRVPRTEFDALWTLSEQLGSQLGPDDGFLIGVVLACRWLAGQPARSELKGAAQMPTAPFTGRRHAAMPETVEAELVSATAAAARHGPRADLARGVVVTLTWAWRGVGEPPLDLSHSAAS